ncbi:hypothetical protein TWF173_009589 [Orbilia oligospora]|uniref:Uncharacterized protein n=1 Tax=Orbilia oligospora TaxID=2813651 RepID=A0A7C8R987_ORBOL|nr:hypothetical protein TWF970_005148 [Orbilia oligospora]KAF3277543.1 hypothetical protein TWF970_005148 [Orbilia oligospora]KAF3317765.1 hypothetical protein TWF173_009589 [Orbilia oligospora]
MIQETQDSNAARTQIQCKNRAERVNFAFKKYTVWGCIISISTGELLSVNLRVTFDAAQG